MEVRRFIFTGPRLPIEHLSTTVVAGVAYEFVGRPFDVLRREAHIYDAKLQSQTPTPNPKNVPPPITHTRISSLPHVFLHTLRTQGLIAFFQAATASSSTRDDGTSKLMRRVYPVLKTLARVGPWGVGFLVWEAVGPGIQ